MLLSWGSWDFCNWWRFRAELSTGEHRGLCKRLQGRKGALVGLGSQTTLNAISLESVAKGCVLLALLASGSPRQCYINGSPSWDCLPQDLQPCRGLSSMRRNACRKHWGLLGARAPPSQAGAAGGGWAAAAPHVLSFPSTAAFGKEWENRVCAGSRWRGVLWGKEPPPQHNRERRFCHQPRLTGGTGAGRYLPLGSIVPLEV